MWCATHVTNDHRWSLARGATRQATAQQAADDRDRSSARCASELWYGVCIDAERPLAAIDHDRSTARGATKAAVAKDVGGAHMQPSTVTGQRRRARTSGKRRLHAATDRDRPVARSAVQSGKRRLHAATDRDRPAARSAVQTTRLCRKMPNGRCQAKGAARKRKKVQRCDCARKPPMTGLGQRRVAQRKRDCKRQCWKKRGAHKTGRRPLGLTARGAIKRSGAHCGGGVSPGGT
jgi:hypothetical protein